MNNNIVQERGRSNNTIKVLLILVLISILGMGGYFVYYTMNGNSLESKEEKLDIASAQVKKLYSFVPAAPDYKNGHNEDLNVGYKGAYQGKKVLVNDISPEVLVALGVYHGDKTENMDAIEYHITSIYIKVKEMYGFTLNYNPTEDFGIEYTGISSIRYNDNNEAYEYVSEGAEPNSWELNHFSVLKSATLKDDVITLYDDHFYITDVCDPWHDDNICYYMYSDAEKTKKIDQFSDIPDFELGNYDAKAVKYKHTFKKNGAGEYFWYSSEPVNE